MKYKYIIHSDYSGEQGHLGGGDHKVLSKRFATPAAAFRFIKTDKSGCFDENNYRDVWIEVIENV